MLEEKDRRALAEIEQHLAAGDPAFAARMTAPPATPGRPFPILSVLGVVVFLTMPFVGLFLGPTAALIVADLAAVTAVVVLVLRHRRGG
ncbi:hypothetical protein AMIS_39140 [Actinoplanes missouriensis 431]|uniref:DUF3040 domain-containing protein n=1 Tax=Actinoplanes missouriensis (strain ATCC 14538 / DSM 43046 / CBS 188.64 / JCM 3121 / NBRC 102363 / NCIMB 12654 / NRRL B-3342 / UNCC 431) TaxID=512565 RepID=I0H7Z7_ACTM4|nr:DUF3040 domain-containing protein [Actinoplanes missouriensis]BAL89134.1 hypothetical protein AMIS_39140 [Actinoplanes missouriensis 431]